MALVTPDYTEAQDQIQPGEYYTRIQKCEEKTSQKGAKYLNWTLETFNEDEPKNNGRMIWYTTMLEGKGAGMLQKFITVVTGSAKDGAFDTDELVGGEFISIVAQDVQGRSTIKGIKTIQ